VRVADVAADEQKAIAIREEVLNVREVAGVSELIERDELHLSPRAMTCGQVRSDENRPLL